MSTKIHPKCPQVFTQKEDFSWTKVSMRSHPLTMSMRSRPFWTKCVHEMSLSTKCLHPYWIILWTHSFLYENLTDFVSPDLKLHNLVSWSIVILSLKRNWKPKFDKVHAWQTEIFFKVIKILIWFWTYKAYSLTTVLQINLLECKFFRSTGFPKFQPIEMHSTYTALMFGWKFGKPVALQCSRKTYSLAD